MQKKTKRSIKWVKLKPIQVSEYAGVHLLADFWSGRAVEDSKELEKILVEAAKKAKNIPLKAIVYKFSPQGMTGVVLLAESHIAIHSWPEIGYVGIDIFTCGERAMPYKALEYLKKEFKPKKVEIKEIKRGKIK